MDNNYKKYIFVDWKENGFKRVQKINNKWGFIDLKGFQICPCIYNDVCDFENGFAIVTKDTGMGFIDTNGNQICPCIFDKVWNFYGTTAKHYVAIVKKNGKYGLIDYSGNYICKCIYDKIEDLKVPYRAWKREKNT